MSLCVLLLFIIMVNGSILTHKSFVPRENNKIRIAVIGAGIGGSSFVHYFNKLNNKYGAVIDIFEKNDYVGGRTKSINIDGEIIELGASIAIKDNQYIYNLVDELSLDHRFVGQQKEIGKTAIWNEKNKNFSFMSYNSDSWLKIPYILWHFGPKKVFDLFMLSRSFVKRMDRMYQYLNKSKTFKTAQQFYEIMDVYYLSQTNCLEYLVHHLHGETKTNRSSFFDIMSKSPILNELVTGITRVNYNQNFYDLNALVCMTSVSAIGSATSDAIWSVKEGNQQLSVRMIQNAIKSNTKPEDNSIKLKLSKKVASITKLDSNAAYKYRLSYYDEKTSKISHRLYDIIVIGAPLSVIDCKFIDFDKDFYAGLNIGAHIKYQTVYVTLVAGRLNQDYFENGNESEDRSKNDDFHQINDLLVGGYYNPKKQRLFNSISRKKVLKNSTNLYKIFSTESINNGNILSQIFSYYDDNIIEKRWNAYPQYLSRAVFPKIIMDDDSMYYLNAVEAGASAMEILTISAKNAALLVHEYVLSKNEKDRKQNMNDLDHDEL